MLSKIWHSIYFWRILGLLFLLNLVSNSFYYFFVGPYDIVSR